MPRSRVLATLLAAGLVMIPLATHAGPYKPDKPRSEPEKAMKMKKMIKVTRHGDAYCFDNAIVRGGVVVATGRCYNFYLVRNSSGAFLAFGPPGPPMIPPGQLVRMNTPAGAKTKGRLFYLVPAPVPVTTIPVGTIVAVPVRVTTPQPGKVVVVATPPSTSGPAREVEWAFDQH
ncbi:MAG: hypothetical protein ACRDGN_17120 [bacterium]